MPLLRHSHQLAAGRGTWCSRDQDQDWVLWEQWAICHHPGMTPSHPTGAPFGLCESGPALQLGC